MQPSTLPLKKFRIPYHKAWVSWVDFRVTAHPMQMAADTTRSLSASAEFCGNTVLTLRLTALAGSRSAVGADQVMNMDRVCDSLVSNHFNGCSLINITTSVSLG